MMYQPPQKQVVLEEAHAAYERVRPEFVRLTRKFEALLIDLVTARGIAFHLIESRTKDPKSFSDKITRTSKAYSNPIKEMTDLSGIRIIAYYEDEANLIGTILQQEFLVDQENSISREASPAEFGYRSAHYIVSLNDARSGLPEYAGLGGMKAEIQVRTVLQHAWAAISHKLQYKREDDVPAPLRRKLFRLSALFELADDEFISLRETSGSVQRDIASRIAAGNLEIPLDGQSLRRYLDTSSAVKTLCANAKTVGFNFDDPTDGEDDDRDNPSDLIQLATISGIPTIAALNATLTEAQPWAQRYLAKQYSESGSGDDSKWHVTPAFVCELILIKGRNSQLRVKNLTTLGWDDGIAKRVFNVARTLAQSGD